MQTEAQPVDHPGLNQLVLEGDFDHVVLQVQERVGTDGLRPWATVAEYSQPGTYKVHLPPGMWRIDCPAATIETTVRATVQPPPRPPKELSDVQRLDGRIDDLLLRVRALEQRSAGDLS